MRPKTCPVASLVALTFLALSGLAVAEDAPFAIRGATIHPVSGSPLTGAVLVVENGRVKEVRADGSVPDGLSVVDATGKVITPGFIDAGSVLGLSADERREGAADLSVLDGFDPYREEEIAAARATGTTTVAIDPPSRGAFAGQGAVLRLVPEASLAEMTLRAPAFERASLGTISQERTTSLQRLEDYYSMQRTFAGVKEYVEQWARYREEYAEYEKKKKEYDEKKAKGEIPATPPGEGPPRAESGGERTGGSREERPGGGRRGGRPPGGGGGERRGGGPGGEERRPPAGDASGTATTAAAGDEKKIEPPKKPQKPPTDPVREALAVILKGEQPLFLECHRASDIRNALRLADEFSLRVVLVGATEAAAVADEIRSRGVAAIVGPVVLPSRRDLARRAHDPSLAAKLHEKGVAVAIGSGALSPEGSRYLNLAAAAAAAEGLPKDAALAAITLRAAEALGVADRVGSLAPGRDADFLIWDRDPLDARAQLEAVYVGGKRVSDDEMRRRG